MVIQIMLLLQHDLFLTPISITFPSQYSI